MHRCVCDDTIVSIVCEFLSVIPSDQSDLCLCANVYLGFISISSSAKVAAAESASTISIVIIFVDW